MEVRVLLGVILMLDVGLGFSALTTLKVSTTTGILHGRRTTTLQKPLRQFLGVPYAQPPVGELRFQPPVEMKEAAATTERDAADYGPSCYQPRHVKSVISPLLRRDEVELSEDCLFLNLYVPEEERKDGKSLPVMVWLPGEGFDYADAQQFDGSFLSVLGKVIVVTVNYRVTVFGFLSTLTPDAPGNAGLMDQRMALKWVQKNIAKFGGDPDNVTLFGRFSGAMGVAIQTFSPLSRQEILFQRSILQSGIPVGDWAFDRNPLNATHQLAKETHCLKSSIADTVACFRRIPSHTLLEHSAKVPQRWRPVFDYRLISEEPLKAAEMGDYRPIDVLLGLNNDEGSLCVIALKALQSPLYEKIVNHELTKEDFAALVEGFMFESYKRQDNLLTKLAVHEYTQKKRNSKPFESFADFCGDIYVRAHVQRLADILAKVKKGRVYMYEFSHRPSFSIQAPFIKAGHGDDVLFALGLPLTISNISDAEKMLTQRMIDAITNFARQGNPNADGAESWPEYSTRQHQLMTFSTEEEESRAKASSHDASVSFWYDVIPAALSHSCPLRPRDFFAKNQLESPETDGRQRTTLEPSSSLDS